MPDEATASTTFPLERKSKEGRQLIVQAAGDGPSEAEFYIAPSTVADQNVGVNLLHEGAGLKFGAGLNKESLTLFDTVSILDLLLREARNPVLLTSVRSALLTRDPLHEVIDSYKIMSREESLPESSSVTRFKMSATSFSAKSSNNSKIGWIIDSGADQNVTMSTVVMFNVVDISYLQIIVGHANGTLSTISHVANLKLANDVILYDVLVVLGYCDLKKEKTLETRSESSGLYLFDIDSDKCICKVNIVMSYNVSKSLWHIRLGYLANQVFSVLKTDLSLSKKIDMLICELTSRSEKCVLMGYSSVKKAYKLFSLDNRNVLYSRDVRFYEIVFPFKRKNKSVNDGVDVDFKGNTNHLTAFDNQMSLRSIDKERVASIVDGRVPSSRINTTQMQASQPSVRRSSRSGKLPAKFNDYVVKSNVEYGLRKNKSNKQATVSRSSAKAEYICMAFAICEIIWIANLLQSLKVTNLDPISLYSDNSSTIHIVVNLVFNEKTKPFEIDVHIVKENATFRILKTEKIHTFDQVADENSYF
ncbi:ribonuclease H-like domain-containing protein [Tanacetum coccineum]